ncbi:pyruvate dehydrogenase (acetyl-transferring) E1 component, alpha subunit [Desulfotomaculum nigrificans CO-1-SRB]|uniref:Pyruvate dehydrogenase E1 component subunit alpha n=1 Tax=Desulfotomaculum nigrificans (strain DSM 14880 / VKM B-2319 / CO-1-SRB) TaxID=868595 RepID=F6B900_DESCC|nr:pyruvate dehydrogenase (acetyl-transferring) E1 component subunit alpha [Desulfotomaculum nigrificans]AEF93651.1 pyruvate dehydrogenase (acetyl-transferring) E1 component, alpha subunit [Desulfotomaculum nigrificans CO-1-SRB]
MELNENALLKMYRTMLTIREFEETASTLFANGEIPGFVHLYSGEEAVAVGIISQLEPGDYIASTHRGHGHMISRGGDIKLMFAELFGKKTGYCKGKGGSMHIADVSLGFLGANGIVGAGLPLAAGAAFACKYKKNGGVAVCFFGDGASNRGTLHESLNIASIWKLPAIFVCENNMYGISMNQKNHQNINDIADRASAYGIPGVSVDGNNVMAVFEAGQEAIKRARNGEGPTLIECKTYRYRGHFEGDPTVYRPDEEVQYWKQRDPIEQFKKRLVEMNVLTEEQDQAIRSEVRNLIREGVEFARNSEYPDVSELLTDVYC